MPDYCSADVFTGRHISSYNMAQFECLSTCIQCSHCTLGPCTGLKFRPRPGLQIWFEAQARPGPQQLCRPGPGPARKLNYEARARHARSRSRPGPQHNCHIWGPGPARARGLRAGPLARPHTTKQQHDYCIRILMGLLRGYVHNHILFQCLCEVMDNYRALYNYA